MDNTGAAERSRATQEAAIQNQAAMRAMAAGDLAGAEAALLRIVGLAKDYVPAWLNLAAIRRQRNDFDGAFNAIQQVLTLDGRNFAALMMSATMLEREGHAVPAALAYGAALANAPPDHLLDAPTLQAVQRGREVHGAYTRQLGDHIRGKVADAQDGCTAAERRRVDSFIETTLRVRRRYQQEPSEYYYPGLPSIEFYERSEFPWLAEFESATDAIREELLGVLREDAAGFTPYIHYDAHMPLDQWRELNNSPQLDVLRVLPPGPADRGPVPCGPRHDARGDALAAGTGAAAIAVRDVLRVASRGPGFRRTPAWRTSAWSCTCRS